MRKVLTPALVVLLLALGAACAGPRLSDPLARLPAPVVRRVEAPAVPTDGVPWPVLPVAEAAALCDT